MKLTAKANTVCVLEILKEHTDYDNILKMGEIIKHMERDYDLKVDRRTVYSCMAVLSEMGYEISTPDDNGKGYYLENRDFDASEIRMLVDSVYSNPGIPDGYSAELAQKLQKLLPAKKRKSYASLTALGTTRKTDNKEVFLNIDLLEEAVANGKKVRFTYLKYGLDKKLKPKREGKYIVSPYAMVAANEHYYLLCNCAAHNDPISQFRIDKIKGIEITDETCVPSPADFSPGKYRDRSIFMYGGEIGTVVLRCDIGLLDHVVDRFGSEIKITENSGGETFDMTVTGSLTGIEYWAENYIESCEVIEPESMRQRVISMIKNNKYKV